MSGADGEQSRRWSVPWVAALIAIPAGVATIYTGWRVLRDGSAPPVDPPRIVQFDARPASVTVGGSVQLRWSVEHATSVSIEPGIGEVALTGSRAVVPEGTTTYVLNARHGDASQTATVVVTTASPTWEDRHAVGTLEGDSIDHFTVDSITTERIGDDLVEVMYARVAYGYNPDHGEVWIGAFALDENGAPLSTGFRPTRAAPDGSTRVPIIVDAVDGRRRSAWVLFWLYERYKGDGFVARRFPYERVWGADPSP